MDLSAVGVVGGLILVLIAFIGTTWKLLRFIFRVDNALPTLLNIAHQFESNGGTTIKDKLDKLTARDDTIFLIADTNAKIVQELSKTQTSEILQIKAYLHESIHSIHNELFKINATQEIRIKGIEERFEERFDGIIPLISRHREDNEK